MFNIAICCLFFFISSCGKLNLSLKEVLGVSTTFLGVVPKFQGLISHQSSGFILPAYASTCSTTDVLAELYLLNESGATIEVPIAKTSLKSDGTFEFDFKKLGLSLSEKIDHTVKITGCDLVFTAPVLVLGEKQIIDSRSTFIAASVHSDTPVKLKSTSREAVKSLIYKLSGETVEDVKANIANNAVAIDQYQKIFGIEPANVDLAPIVGIIPPKNKIQEDQPFLFSPVIEKLDASYSAVYEWKLDGLLKSQSLNWSYQPGKNDQGIHNVSLRVGANDGSGKVDTSRPYFEKAFTVTVDNTFFPSTPSLILSNTFVKNTSITVNFDKSGCSTFSKVAITTTANPLSADFIYTCSDSNIPVALSSGDGVKKIYIQSKDDHGDISSQGSATVILDTIAPNLSSNSSLLSGGYFSGLKNELVSYIVADLNLGSNPMSFEYSTDSGSSWNSVASNEAAFGSYLWNLPDIDASSVKFRIIAKDLAGNESILVSSSNFTIDSTLPEALVATLDQGASTSTSNITATVTSCSADQVYMLMNESSTQPSANDSSWSPCLSTLGALKHTLVSATNGTKTLYLWAKDLAGNISVSATKTINYDTIPPVIALTAPVNNFTINDSNKSAVSFSGTCTENGGIDISGDIAGTFNCTAGSFGGVLNFTSAADGDLSVTLNQTDLAGNSATPVTVNLKKDTVIPSLAITAPAASSFINNANQSSFNLTGTCSEDSRQVQISGAINASVNCNAGVFSTNLNMTSVAEGNISISLNHSDLAGNNAPVVTRSFIKDTIAPVITQTSFTNGNYVNSDGVTFGGVCENGSTIVISGTDSSNITCSSGSWSYTTQNQNTDGAFGYTFTHTDSAGNSNSLVAGWIRETVKPEVKSVLIAEGAEFVGTSFVVIDVEATDNTVVKSLRFKNANSATSNCQTEYEDDSWQPYSYGVQRYSVAISPGDGEKKICVWAKDQAGNVSQIAPPEGTEGVDMDTVRYEVGNPPKVIAFEVHDGNDGTDLATNQDVTISWTVTDEEELDENPISLYYTTQASPTANWTPIVLNHGNNGLGKKSFTGTYTSFKAPGSGYFRVKIVAKDSAGNTSLPSEKTLNTGSWSVFAGSTDSGVGGSALGLRLQSANNVAGQYAAIDPKTNDAYVVSSLEGIYKLNAITGKTEVFIPHGTTNFVDGNVLDSSTRIRANHLRLAFDKNGLLYMMENPLDSAYHHGIIWQINLQTKVIKKYLGGGNKYDQTATAATAHVQYGFFTFDESNSLYYIAHCNPAASWDNTSLTGTGARLLKAIQNTVTKSVDSIAVVAGDCSRGVPASGADSLNAPFIERGIFTLGGMAVWENGKKIYYRFNGSGSYKINNGITYKSNLGLTPYYDFDSGSLYSGGSSITKATLNFSGDSGDVQTVYVSSSGEGECLKDSVHRLSSCISAYMSPFKGPSGKLAFKDGIVGNAGGTYTVRFVDEDDNLKTYLGTPPFYGDTLDKSFMKSNIGGIYYKKSSELNQAAFPEGLYFADGVAMVFGVIDSQGTANIIAGNQSKQIAKGVDGVNFDKSLTLGQPYSAGRLMSSLAFNNEGLPLLKVASSEKSMVKVEADNTIKYLTASTGIISQYFDNAPTGSNPSRYGLHVYGGANNLVLKDESKLFLFGAYISATDRVGVNSAAMKLFNYASSTGVTHIMGDTASTAATSLDEANPGLLANKTFNTACRSSTSCYLQYRDDEDRIYFSEGTKLRYITNPENPALSTLGTLLTATRTIFNFIFSEDGSQLFYISSGKLYCKDISSGKAWCDERVLGPTLGMEIISNGPNQLTWKDSNTLLISTYSGMIYQYTILD